MHTAETRRESYRRQRAYLIALLGGKCVQCGTDDPAVLEFDHNEPRTWIARHTSRWVRVARYAREAIDIDETGRLTLTGRVVLRCATCFGVRRATKRKANPMLATVARIGKPIRTFTNKRIYPLDPRPDEICIEDIAHSLSNICRFTGHADFYSVAEHSLFVASCVDPRYRLQALMHDAAEAYLNDIASPNKGAVYFKIGDKFESYKDVEERVLRVIFDTFSIPWPDEWAWETIHKADTDLLDQEQAGLYPWTQSARPYQPWAPRKAESLFLDAYHKLRIA